MLGAESAGKSTLVGALLSGKKDNGKGILRPYANIHKHELMDGRTSSLTY